MRGWQNIKLGDLVTLHYGKALKAQDRLDGEIPVFSSAGITGYHNKALVDSEAIIIGRKGSVGTVYKTNGAFCCIDTAYYILPENEKYNFVYLFYLLKTLRLYELNEDSAVPGLNRQTAYEQDLLLPPLPEQKAIADVLSALDDKIDLLQRQNETLEKMAETLFRQWFIEEAKEDWESKSVLDLVSLVGGGTPKTSVDSYWNGDIPWLSGGDIANSHKNFINYSQKMITEEGLNNSSVKLLPKFSTVITARGTVGKVGLLAQPMTFSQSNYGVISKYKNSEIFTYLLITYLVDELMAAAYGSVFDTITTRTFEELEFNFPSIEYIELFNNHVKSLFDKKLVNTQQIQTLQNLRDTLLPKLMSGEVRVKLD